MIREDPIVAALRARKCRITPARRAIAGCFAARCKPLSAQDVCAALKRGRVRANLTTVYRELQFLAAQGMLKAVFLQDGVQRYERASLPHHHHLVCLGCGTIAGVDMEGDLSRLERAIARARAFLVERHSLEFYGRCRDCR